MGVDAKSCLKEIELAGGAIDELIDNSELKETICAYDEASVFLQGACDVFAYALYKRFGYEIWKVIHCDGITHHWFGRSAYQGEIINIDVRGMTTDFDAFLSGLVFSMGNNYCVKHMKPEDVDTKAEGFDFGLQCAYDLIDDYHEYYEC